MDILQGATMNKSTARAYKGGYATKSLPAPVYFHVSAWVRPPGWFDQAGQIEKPGVTYTREKGPRT